MTDLEILPPVNSEAAQQKQTEIDGLLEQISAHELRLAKHFARLSRLVREVKVEQYWIPLGYDRFTSYLEVIRKKIGRERSQMYAVLSVSEVLHLFLTDEELETVGITKAHELKRLVKGEGAGENLKKIKVSKGTPLYETLETVLNDKDYLFLVLSAPVGEPKKLSYTFAIQQTK